MSKTKKRIIWIIALVVIIAGGFWYSKSKKSAIVYTTEETKKGDIERTISVTGMMVSENQVDLAFELSGRASLVNVSVGDVVTEGQLLAQIDDSVLQSQLEESKLALNIQVEAEKLARRNWDSLKPEEKQAQKDTSEKARAAVRTVANQMERTKIYAPFNGVVTAVDIEEGEVATVGMAVISVAGEGNMEIESNIPESDIAEVSPGQKAETTFDALSNEDIFEAEVMEIDPASTVIQGVVYYRTKMKLIESDDRIKIGMSLDADILTAKKENVLMIPERAIKTENGVKMVEILQSENRTRKTEVKTGLKGDSGMIEIISGINEGDKVVTFSK
ncbi:MAG: efflux RND transporter periplasmic adaptor subunit [Candidatus Moranbacteria bacterium]|jgi:RND family efflux transporter MFP subunit|nr:efflux RND transporter periplasmic adaptor subunit [Candidatus Moranbacteria bacterium]